MNVQSLIGLGALIVFAASSSAGAAEAQSSAAAIQNLKQITSSLGYKVQTEKPSEFSFSDGTRTAWMELSGNAENVYITIGFDFPKESMGKVPGLLLLEWNDTHENYFSVHKNDDGSGIVNLYHKIPTKMANTASINQAITSIRSDVDQHLDLIDSDRWK